MFTTTFVYILLTFLIFWAYCGYFLTLYLLSLFGSLNNPNKINKNIKSKVSLLIPCFNEEGLVADKVVNIKELEYPKELLEIYFLDGSSTDGTVEILREKTKDMDNVKIIETGGKGKINQINFILPKLNSEVVVNTDMDTLMEKDVLFKLVSVFESDPEVAVVGAHVMPKSNLKMELQYWDDQNQIRFLESKVHSSSIVIAPCYGFRSNLLEKFPDDCIADDIYISFLSNVKGRKSKYVEDAIAYEMRTPANIDELLKHKFRKGNAYIIELLRFLYMLPIMKSRWKVIYLTKFLQVIIMPWVIPFFILSSISQILSGADYLKLPAFAFIFLFMSLLMARMLISKGRKISSVKRHKRRSFITLFFVTNFILFVNGITFPFFRQTSNYSKINEKNVSESEKNT